MLKPKCVIKSENGRTASLGHSAEGYLTPCCWIDGFLEDRGISQDIFYQEKFKISNVKNIKEITQSKEWVEFYTMLQEHPEQAPRTCWKVCNEDSVGDKYGDG